MIGVWYYRHHLWIVWYQGIISQTLIAYFDLWIKWICGYDILWGISMNQWWPSLVMHICHSAPLSVMWHWNWMVTLELSEKTREHICISNQYMTLKINRSLSLHMRKNHTIHIAHSQYEDTFAAVKLLPMYLMDSFPVFVALFPNFGHAVIQDLNCLSIDIEENVFLFPMWQFAFAQTVQVGQFLKRFIPMIKSGSHVYISNTVNVSSQYHAC